MAKIDSLEQYDAVMLRIEELLKIVDDGMPANDKNVVELALLSDLIEEYEDIHYPIGKPSLIDTIKLRLYEMNITQSKLAEMLGISPARVSAIMTGKCEPTLKVGREICLKLNISPNIVLGV